MLPEAKFFGLIKQNLVKIVFYSRFYRMPVKQIDSGIAVQEITYNMGLIPVIHTYNDNPLFVTLDSTNPLQSRGLIPSEKDHT